MAKLPILIHFCDNNRYNYGNKTYDQLSQDSRFQVEKWNCLSITADNCGERCRAYCDKSPYVVIGDKTIGEEITGRTHEALLEKLLASLD